RADHRGAVLGGQGCGSLPDEDARGRVRRGWHPCQRRCARNHRHGVPRRCPGNPRARLAAPPRTHRRPARGRGRRRVLALAGRLVPDRRDHRRQRRPLHGLTVPMLSYDLHVHPAPSVARRWGDGLRVWQAAAEAGVLGFVWKAHEEHTVARCRELPAEPVRAFGSASLNPWAGFDDVTGAIEAGALWLWGPTQDTAGAIGWERPLPRDWSRIVGWLREFDGPLVLATAHLGAEGRAAFVELAADRESLVCSVTHSLYVPLEEARALAACGCVFEVDAYTYV